MADPSKIRFTCWKCNKSFEVNRRSEGKIFECSGCGEKNVAIEESEAQRRADFERRNFKCPTCQRWVRREAEECLNCGRPFMDPLRLETFLVQEPEIKASLARTVSEVSEIPIDRSFPWALLILIIIASAAGAILLFLLIA